MVVRSNGKLMLFNNTANSGITIDTAANVGIGVTPSAWAAAVKALQIGAIAAASYDGTNYDISSNRYLASGGTSTYIATGFATMARQVSGQHLWYNAPSGTAGNAITFTQAMTLDASGNLLVGVASANANGGVLQLKSGITFPATQVASTDANTLDDYEEGTFTPTIQGSTTTGAGTYVANTGRYTKVGNLVTFQVYIEWTAHTGVGNMRIGGLPFTNTANFWAGSVGYANNIALTAGNIMTGYVESSSPYVTLSQYPTGGGATTGVPIDTAGAIIFSASYTVA
jgi:hypothetical protein